MPARILFALGSARYQKTAATWRFCAALVIPAGKNARTANLRAEGESKVRAALRLRTTRLTVLGQSVNDLTRPKRLAITNSPNAIKQETTHPPLQACNTFSHNGLRQ